MTPVRSGYTRTGWARLRVQRPVPAERRNVLGKRTSRALRASVLAAGLVLGLGSGAHAKRVCDVAFITPDAALEQGLGAYQAGFFSIALPALTCAADQGLFLAQFHLARLYADSSSTLTDHRRAYELYREIVEKHASSIDVDDDDRAPYVGRAITSYAAYWLRGLPEAGVRPNPEYAAFLLQQAATFFRNADAQFELAKLYLKGEGVPEDRKKALHWLKILTDDAHAGAQAFFADLLWRGKIVPKEEKKALALITIAVENAPAHERIWIEDIYRSIYCGTATGARQQADGLIASFRRLYSAPRSAVPAERFGLGISPTLTCEGGEVIDVPRQRGRDERSSLSPASREPGPHQGVMGVREQQSR
jgi:hypothetical protein